MSTQTKAKSGANIATTSPDAGPTRHEINPPALPPSLLPRMAFSLKETAQILGISYVSAFRLVQRNLLKSSNALRTKVIARSEIERFLADTTK